MGCYAIRRHCHRPDRPLLLTRLMSSLLYQVGTLDLATFTVTPLLFLSIALLASYLPARGAMRVDPAEALRGN